MAVERSESIANAASLEIGDVTESDLSEIQELVSSAMEGDRLDQCLFPDQEDKEKYKRKWAIGKYTKQIQEDHNSYLFKVTDTGKNAIVGFADMTFVPGENGQNHVVKKAMGYDAPDGMSKELFDEIISKFEHMKPMYLNTKRPHYHITMLATLPEAQGRGVGSMLLQRITEMADEAEADVYLEATPVGLRLYRKHGIEERARLDFTGGGERLVMLRRAKNAEAENGYRGQK